MPWSPSRLRDGLLRDSLACECAQRHGISERITARAAELTEHILAGDTYSISAALTDAEAVAQRQAEDVAHRFLELDLTQVPAQALRDKLRDLLRGRFPSLPDLIQTEDMPRDTETEGVGSTSMEIDGDEEAGSTEHGSKSH